MATHVALAGLSLSSMSGRLLLLAVLLALVGLLLVKHLRDTRAAAGTDVDSDVEPSEDDVVDEHVDPRSLVSQVSTSPAAPVAAAAVASPASVAQVAQVAESAVLTEPVSAVATAERATEPVPAQAAPVAATRPTPTPPPAPAVPARPARPAGLFAPVPDSAISAGGRAPGATIVPKF